MSACRGCGKESTTDLEVVKDEAVVVTASLCDACYQEAIDGFKECQRQFQFLVDNGVSRERANEIMIERIDKGLA